jgi:hypothetical protein
MGWFIGFDFLAPEESNNLSGVSFHRPNGGSDKSKNL